MIIFCSLGMANTRMRDYFDLWTLAQYVQPELWFAPKFLMLLKTNLRYTEPVAFNGHNMMPMVNFENYILNGTLLVPV